MGAAPVGGRRIVDRSQFPVCFRNPSAPGAVFATIRVAAPRTRAPRQAPGDSAKFGRFATEVARAPGKSFGFPPATHPGRPIPRPVLRSRARVSEWSEAPLAGPAQRSEPDVRSDPFPKRFSALCRRKWYVRGSAAGGNGRASRSDPLRCSLSGPQALRDVGVWGALPPPGGVSGCHPVGVGDLRKSAHLRGARLQTDLSARQPNGEMGNESEVSSL